MPSRRTETRAPENALTFQTPKEAFEFFRESRFFGDARSCGADGGDAFVADPCVRVVKLRRTAT